VIRIVIDHDVVAVPQPIVGEAVVVRCNAEEEAANIKPFPVSSSKPEDVLAAEASTEAAAFERPIETIVRIATSGIMSHPPSIGHNPWNFPVLSLRFFPDPFRNSRRSRTVLRNVSTALKTAAMLPTAMPAATLREASGLGQTGE
jgi:hypothetical protein